MPEMSGAPCHSLQSSQLSERSGHSYSDLSFCWTASSSRHSRQSSQLSELDGGHIRQRSNLSNLSDRSAQSFNNPGFERRGQQSLHSRHSRQASAEMSRAITPSWAPSPPPTSPPPISLQLSCPLAQLVGRCSLLHYLDILGCSLVSSLVSSQQPHHSRELRDGLALTHLDLTDCTRLDDQSLRLILEAAHSIEFLYVRRSSNLTGEFSNKLTIVSPR